MRDSLTDEWHYAALGRYAELHPETLEAIRARCPVAYLPWGALEWHGPHLPLGLDGMTAEAIAERVARRTGGVVLPTTWWPVTTLPHASSIDLPSPLVRSLWDGIFTSLHQSAWPIVVVISGHYAQGHELVLMQAARNAISLHGQLVFAIPPLALVDEDMLDHAGLWETSLLLALRPDLVRLEALGSGTLRTTESAVLGRDPRAASNSLGQRVLGLAVERIVGAVQNLLASRDPAPLLALYDRRRERYQAYFQRYGTAIEPAIQAWWREQCAADDGTAPQSLKNGEELERAHES
ncbi:creatininase family protein [Candidatus Gracilibacteria bacterium]|nr:creatininase family protein [Candidatus Gracilibacteria bacterium]